ncbi:hypothetical protein F5876DRAFT_51089 [Lentinula aff. lateritia]|uniref:Uncharacterized protein n=1 Tax=Lentinula aff. lateritia TaxID=2804960 RepID=A0ACC1TMT6_9AGAR|nr:hypothetical protein F5876DRAFT_51089 [Lentinula aff. lateritia]
MASIAATSYFSHPWFDKPSMKRRRSTSSGEDDALDKTLSPISAKRRRVIMLEKGFSNLSLHHPPPVTSTSSANPNSVTTFFDLNHSGALPSSSPLPLPDTLTAMEVEYSSISPSIQPDSVEEPTSPSLSVPEIRMKGSSWYEPEPDRIVVTDLDSSDDEYENEREPVSPLVSPTLLERIRQRELSNVLPLPSSLDRHALVLYRPLTRPSNNLEPEDTELVSNQDAVPDAVSLPSTAQDVEMMDVE